MEVLGLIVLAAAGLAIAVLAVAALAYRTRQRRARLRRERSWLHEAEPRMAARLAALQGLPSASPVVLPWKPPVQRVAKARMARPARRASRERRRQIWRDASTALIGFAILGSAVLLLGQGLPRGEVQGVTAPPGGPAAPGDPLFSSLPAVVGTTLQPSLDFGPFTPDPGATDTTSATPPITGPTATPLHGTPQPTARPPATPRPTSRPTTRPTQAPTSQPTAAPTATPVPPTSTPSPDPTAAPTPDPTPPPTPEPTPTLPPPTATATP